MTVPPNKKAVEINGLLVPSRGIESVNPLLYGEAQFFWLR